MASTFVEDEENAAELKFGKEFEDCFENKQILSNDEVFLLLATSKRTRPNESVLSLRICLWMMFLVFRIFQQTFSYLEQIATTKILEDVTAMVAELRMWVVGLLFRFISSEA
jgi:hypothetical protein